MLRAAAVGIVATLALCAPRPALAQGRLWVDPGSRATPLRDRLRALRGRADAATLDSIEALLTFEGSRPVRRRPHALPWIERAERYLDALESGRDPFATEARGEITLRAYRSDVSELPQRYAVYVPPGYDPSRRYPLLVALHGGSSNGNLFAALMLGARVPWARYRRHWDRPHEPRLHPEWIVVAPDGFGNSIWRFLGERDVLDVIADVRARYSVDPDRVVLAGLSNGGLGSYNVGARHAWRFSAVIPMAGAPGWVHYLGAHPDEAERRMLGPCSGWALFENARNTFFHAHHGRRDPGPMRPRYIEHLAHHAEVLDVPFALDWYVAGHDLVGPVQRSGRIFDRFVRRRRDARPSRVTLVTGDYRAARQHWVEVTRIDGYPSLARVEARAEGGRVSVRTDRVRALVLHLDEAPLGGRAALFVDGQRVSGATGGRVSIARGRDGRWRIGRPPARGKRPGLSGPLPDASWDRLIHVYGTQDPAHTATLREAAEAGARGWLGNLRRVRQPVIADRDLTAAHLSSGHLVLYGSPGDNAVLERIADRLPIRVEPGAVVVGGTRHFGRRVGTRFVYPSPLAPGRYVVVQAGATPEAVLAGDRLAAFLPDWVVYDGARLPARRTNLPVSGTRAAGFFDDRWRLAPAQ